MFLDAAKQIKRAFTTSSFSIGTLYRLKIADILSSLDKVLYLDSDVIVTQDISGLWNTDITNYYCAAVKDAKSTRSKFSNKRHFKKMGIDPNKYFNAGVILFNLKKSKRVYPFLMNQLTC